MELVKSSTTHFTVTPLEFVRNQKIEINGDKINGGVENVKDVNEKGKDLSVRLIGSFRYWWHMLVTKKILLEEFSHQLVTNLAPTYPYL